MAENISFNLDPEELRRGKTISTTIRMDMRTKKRYDELTKHLGCNGKALISKLINIVYDSKFLNKKIDPQEPG